MGPKMAAAIRFLEAGGPEALITSPWTVADALAGRTGTRVVAAEPVALDGRRSV
jgi:carbamate kinase